VGAKSCPKPEAKTAIQKQVQADEAPLRMLLREAPLQVVSQPELIVRKQLSSEKKLLSGKPREKIVVLPWSNSPAKPQDTAQAAITLTLGEFLNFLQIVLVRLHKQASISMLVQIHSGSPFESLADAPGELFAQNRTVNDRQPSLLTIEKCSGTLGAE
jgi:hypothetical protein